MPSLESVQESGENHLQNLGQHQKEVMNGTSAIANSVVEVLLANANQVLSKSNINYMPLQNNFASLVRMENGELIVLLEEDPKVSCCSQI